MSYRLRLGTFAAVAAVAVAAGVTASAATSAGQVAGDADQDRHPVRLQWRVRRHLRARHRRCDHRVRRSTPARSRTTRTTRPRAWPAARSAAIRSRSSAIGCSDDTPDLAIKETQRLMEQLGADILIGPLSGDEAVAVANYAKAHPTKTFVNGTAGAQDTTLQSRRRTSSASTATAPSGTRASARSRTTSSTGRRPRSSWTTTASAGRRPPAFIADFCARGGKITKRVFAAARTRPTTRRRPRSFRRPSQVDGYFWAVGGTGTVPSLKAFEQLYGPLEPEADHRATCSSARPATSRTIGSAVDGRLRRRLRHGLRPSRRAAARSTRRSRQHWFNQLPAARREASPRGNGFFFNYYIDALGADEGPEGGQGQHLGGQEALPEGPAQGRRSTRRSARVNARREPPGDRRTSTRIQIDAKAGRHDRSSTVRTSPNVDQTFGGLFTPTRRRRAGRTRRARRRRCRGRARARPSSTVSSSR